MGKGHVDLAGDITKLIMDHYSDGKVVSVDLGEVSLALAWTAGFFMAGVSSKSFKTGLNGMSQEIRKIRLECQRSGVAMPTVVVEDDNVHH